MFAALSPQLTSADLRAPCRSKRPTLATPPALGLGWMQARGNPGPPTTPPPLRRQPVGERLLHLDTMNATLRSSKEEIATAAVEIIDTQQDRIAELQQRQTILLALLGLVAVLELL